MARKSKPRRKATAPPTPTPEPTRRDVLLKAAQYATGAAVVGVGGVLTVRSVKAHAHEHDLTRMGQGKPTVVQVHDPTCPTCTALQRQTRAALSSFGECDMLYLVADIKTDEGAMFASRYGVPHVTLLLFDADGNLQDTLTGMRYEEELQQAFAVFAGVTES